MGRSAEPLWQALEQMPTLGGVRVDWEQEIGNELPILWPFLEPQAKLVTGYPCPFLGGNGCPRNVVIHSDDDIVAVCGQPAPACDKLRLTKEDLVAYHLSFKGLASALRKVLGFAEGKSDVELERPAYSCWFGEYSPLAGFRFPAYLVIRCDPHDVAAIINEIAFQEAKPFVVVLPTRRSLLPKTALALRARGVAPVFLSDITEIDEAGKFQSNGMIEDHLSEFRERHLPAKASMENNGMAFFDTPAEARWSDVKLRFRDGHTVSVNVRGVRGMFTYAQMGMVSQKNGEPTKQWELLRAFAEKDGTLTWESRHAGRRNQKRREFLSRDLARFFRIEGDPIGLTDDGKGWEARLGVREAP